MKTNKPPVLFVTTLACLAVLMPTSAYAYLDPGTGAFAVQSAIAGIAGGLIAMRAYGRRILGLLRRSKAAQEDWTKDASGNGQA